MCSAKLYKIANFFGKVRLLILYDFIVIFVVITTEKNMTKPAEVSQTLEEPIFCNLLKQTKYYCSTYES